MLWIIIGTLFLIFLYSSFDIVDGDKTVFVSEINFRRGL